MMKGWIIHKQTTFAPRIVFLEHTHSKTQSLEPSRSHCPLPSSELHKSSRTFTKYKQTCAQAKTSKNKPRSMWQGAPLSLQPCLSSSFTKWVASCPRNTLLSLLQNCIRQCLTCVRGHPLRFAKVTYTQVRVQHRLHSGEPSSQKSARLQSETVLVTRSIFKCTRTLRNLLKHLRACRTWQRTRNRVLS